MTVDLPPGLSPKMREALEEAIKELVGGVSRGLTGSLGFDFQEGLAISRKVTDVRRFGKKKDARPGRG